MAVRHSDGSYARYYHLKEKGSLYKVGERVGRGQQIAWSGNTGYTGGPHLHLISINLLPEEPVYAHEPPLKHCQTVAVRRGGLFVELPSTPLRCKVVHVRTMRCVATAVNSRSPWIALHDRDPASAFSAADFLAEQGAVCCEHLE